MSTAQRPSGVVAMLVTLVLVAAGLVTTSRVGSIDEPAAAAPVVRTAATGHPFLIVRKSEYAALRAKADQYPWNSMKQQAAANCRLSYSTRSATSAAGKRIRDVMGGCALMYILDPANASTYRNRMTRIFDAWPALLRKMKAQYPHSSNRWLQVVPPSSGFFNSVLALDVLHDDLPAARRRAYENRLDDVAEWYWSANRGWGTATYGVRAIWATYQGDTDRRATAAAQYRAQYLAWLTADGGFRDGPEYAFARNGGERTAKQGFLYVAEYTGVDPTYYSDPQVVGAMEWLWDFAYGPFNQIVGFGDAGSLGRDLSYYVPPTAIFTAGRFSAEAARGAARHLRAGLTTMPGDLLSYSVTRKAPAKATAPASRVWPASGAAFWQSSTSTEALMGALWNPRLSPDQVTDHMHPDVNGLYLSGYGQPLLVNSGYAGYGKGALGTSWSTLHGQATASNTATLDGNNHLTKAGDGVTDFLTGNGLDYASGLGDQILPGAARHLRNFVMVQPQNGKNGYFLSLDEVTGADPGRPVDLWWHPASADVATVDRAQEYRWNVTRRPGSARLSIFLASKPRSATVRNAVIAGWTKNLRGKALDARYTTDADGAARAVTVLFPSDADHAKAAMMRLAGNGWSGARIKQGKVRDYALTGDGGPLAVGGVRLIADSAVFRRTGDATSFYFVRDASYLDDGQGRGMSADHPVSLQLRGKTGSVSANAPTTLTLYHPGIRSVRVDGEKVTSTAVSGGRQFRVPAGRHTLTLR